MMPGEVKQISKVVDRKIGRSGLASFSFLSGQSRSNFRESLEIGHCGSVFTYLNLSAVSFSSNPRLSFDCIP